MLQTKIELIRKTIELATGADITVKTDESSLRVSVNIWFTDISQRNGPFLAFGPSGLKRHTVKLQLGMFSGPILKQMAKAEEEEIQLSRALVSSINKNINIKFPESMGFENWTINDPDFTITAERKNIENNSSESALI